MSKNVLVIGSINVDYSIYTDRVPTLGETVTGKEKAFVLLAIDTECKNAVQVRGALFAPIGVGIGNDLGIRSRLKAYPRT